MRQKSASSHRVGSADQRMVTDVMRIQVVSKGLDVSESLRARLESGVGEIIQKYLGRPGEGFIVVAREGAGFRVDCSVHLPTGALLQSHAQADDAHAAADLALERLDKRMRRYKRRLTDRRADRAQEGEPAMVTILHSDPVDDDSDLSGDGEEDDDGFEPVVIAEMPAQVPNLTVSMAVRELNMTGAPALMFRNAAHGGLSVVYRRPDGHIGWIDPERGRAGS